MKDFIKQRLHESLTEVTNGGIYTVYHGSKAVITNFSDEFVGKEEAIDQEGPGIYFTTSLEEAQAYGPNVYTVTLSPRKLMDTTPTNPNKLRTLVTKMLKSAPNWKETAQNFDENPLKGITMAIENMMDYNDTEKDVAQQIWYDFYRYHPIEYLRNMVKLGIDGIIIPRYHKEGNHVIVYNPSIIKIHT